MHMLLSFLLLFFCLAAHAELKKSHCIIPLATTDVHAVEPLAQLLPDRFMVANFQVSANCTVVQSDIERQFDCITKKELSRDELLDTLHRLAQKKRFLSADCTIECDEQAGVSIDIVLHLGRVIDRVEITGMLMDKHRYRQLYQQTPGELFNEELHQVGLMKIFDALRDEGYFSAKVEDLVQEDAQFYTVKVLLSLKRGAHYKIGSTSVKIQCEEEISQREQHHLHVLAQRHVHHAWMHNYYERSLVNQEIAAVKKILADRGFLNPVIRLCERIDHATALVHLQLEVVLGNKSVFMWYGNRFFSQGQLLEHLQLFGSSLALIPSALLAEEIVSLYKKYGFWQVKVDWREDAERTYFFINEGKRSSVIEITFRGAASFEEKELIRSCGAPLLQSHHFDAELLKQFLFSLGEVYAAAGFWDMQIKEYEYVHLSEERYRLVVSITEGLQRWLCGVELLPSCPVQPNVLGNCMCIAQPIPFDINQIKAQRFSLTRALRNAGRLYAIPMPELVQHEKGDGYFTLRWGCAGIREQVRFGKTVLSGNTRVPSSLILRELCYKEGDRWDYQKIAATISRLKELGIFDVVSLVPDDISHPEVVKNIILQCNADTPYETRARIGIQGVNRNVVKWNGGVSPKVGVSFIARNPAQQADLLRFDIDYTRYMHDLSMDYSLPWIGNCPVGAHFQLMSSRYDQPVYIGSPAVLYRASHDGLVVGFGKTYGTLSGGFSFSLSRLGLCATPCDSCAQGSCSRPRALSVARSLEVDPLFFATKPWYVIFEGTMMIDSRDDKVNPHEGSLTVVALQAVGSMQVHDASFAKGLCEYGVFLPLSPDAVLGVHLRAGAIGGAPFDRIMPPERFYLGGPYSLRCYESDYAPPLNSFVTCKGVKCFVPTGGKFMANVNVEVRFPVYKQLGAAVFFDGGSLASHAPYTQKQEAITSFHCMGALGGGLRLNTAIGPLRFDLGVRLQRDRSIEGEVVCEKRWAWFITLGHPF